LGLHPLERITEFNIAELVNKAFLKTATPEKGISGFRAAGICPLNRHKFNDKDYSFYKTASVEDSNDTSANEDNPVCSGKIVTKIEAGCNVELPSSTTSHTSVSSILPLPQQKTKPKSKRTKQRSQIFTSTPQKLKLEEALRRKKANRKLQEVPPKKRGRPKIHSFGDEISTCFNAVNVKIEAQCDVVLPADETPLQKAKPKSKRTKQTSQILTATPQKLKSEEADEPSKKRGRPKKNR